LPAGQGLTASVIVGVLAVRNDDTRLRRYEPAPPPGAGHIVMADPEDNEFCRD
jgi:hypothetical protein